MRVIFCHIPKCAGLSVRKHLEYLFGKDRILTDYTHVGHPTKGGKKTPPISGHIVGQLRQNEHNTVVAGHFKLSRYAHIPAAQRLVWFRDPVERLASHYYYWLKGPDLEHPHSQTLVRRGLSLTQFGQLPELRNIFTRYLDGIPLIEVDCLGLIERYGESVQLMYNYFGVNKDPSRVQAWKNKNQARATSAYPLDDLTREAIQDLNREDMELYRLAQERFEYLLERYGKGY